MQGILSTLQRLTPIAFTLPVLALGITACENPIGGGGGHRFAAGVVVRADSEAGPILFRQLRDEPPTGDGIALQLGQTRVLDVAFLNADGGEFRLTGGSHPLHAEVIDPAIASSQRPEGRHDRLQLTGVAAGSTGLRVYVWHGTPPGGHADWQSDWIPVVVSP